jgi:flagellar biosynthesis GTPase FlhF
MARLTKKKTEAAQAAEVATENKETLAAEAAAEVAAEAVKATEEAAEPTPYEAALKEAEKQAEEAAKAAEKKKVKAQFINSANRRAVIDTSDTVTLCLNYPQDLELAIPTSKGTIERIILRGNNTHLRGKEKGINPVGAYGVTPNVPRAAWEWFCKNYPEFWLIKEHLLFCATKDDKYSVEAETDERKALRNGFEPAAKMAGPEGREGSVTPVE